MILGNRSFFSLAPFTIASMMLGWSDPRFTKQCVTPASHSASKKANDVVYMVGGVTVVVDNVLTEVGLLNCRVCCCRRRVKLFPSTLVCCDEVAGRRGFIMPVSPLG